MRTRLILFLKYYLFWTLFFVAQKPLFMIWQHSLMGDVRAIDWLLVPWHGLPLDLSVAAYITVVFGLILCISFWVRWDIMGKVADGLTALLLFVAGWAILGDNGCFPSWGYHIDKDIFSYLASPREALACAPWWVWTLGVVGFCILFAVWWLIYRWWMRPAPEKPQSVWWLRAVYTFLMFLLTGCLFLPMRGSVTVSTMNTGRVYYSDNRMLNLAAVNPVFNVIESLSENAFDAERYRYMDSAEAQLRMQHLRPSEGQPSERLFTTQRPNILLVILESFSMNAWEAMPNMQRLAAEGIFFSQTYANSFRTDRGVMAVLGGFPGCATASVMCVPSKSQRLPQIGQVLQANGYQLKFYYGGDEDFTNMRSYLVTGGFEDRVSDHSFPLSDRLTKWGVPDHIVFDYVWRDIAARQDSTPHFDVLLSLSSHEPFEVDYAHLDHPFLNAIAYTDSCLGAMIDSLRMTPMWENTVVALVADHGYPYPNSLKNFEPKRYAIPLIFCGGAIAEPKEVTTLCSQIDWVPTMLHQLGLSAEPFVFAKDILDTCQTPYAYYNFVDGFALIKDSATVIYDAAADCLLSSQDEAKNLPEAKAVTQSIMELLYSIESSIESPTILR